MLRLLGLGHCRDTLVGDGGLMQRGISGGERKRLTTAEMVVGPQRVLLMDKICNGLDSATLHSVVSFITEVRCRLKTKRGGSSAILGPANAQSVPWQQVFFCSTHANLPSVRPAMLA